MAVIVLGLLFRKPLLGMLGRVSRITYPGGEAELAAAVAGSARDLQDAVEEAAHSFAAESAGRSTVQQEQIETVVRDAAEWGWRMARISDEKPQLSITWSDGQPRLIFDTVMINDADRLALVALFAGYLEEPPRHDPHPKSYAAASARLGWSRTQLLKRIEYLRARLHGAGVPGMEGRNALANLADYALGTGMITKDDRKLLPPEDGDEGGSSDA